MEKRGQPTEVVIRSNEKLLKAVIALLALKDEHFLDELRAIFQMAAQTHSDLGGEAPDVWAEIEKELKVVRGLVGGGDAQH